MIDIKNLSRIFQTEEVETTALSGIDLQIHAGDFVTIMGPSGCGKSTLLNIMGLLDSATSGSFKLFDQQMIGIREKIRADVRKENIGFVFQSFNLIDELTVYDNIELPLIYNKVSPKARKVRVLEMAEKLQLLHRLKHFPQQLSGGQQQRVAVARALINQPKIILADEPTGNLDSKNGNDVMELLTELHAQGATIVMVTHSQSDAAYSQRTVFMRDGVILSEKTNTRTIDVFTQKNK